MDARGVSQIRNPYLDTKFREQYSDVGYFDQKAAIMEQMEGILSDPEVEGTGIKDALTVLSQALADFSQHPYQETNANIVLNAFKGVTQVLNEYDTNLKSLEEQTKNDLSIAVDDINTKLQQLSELNQTIAHEIFVNADYDGVNYGPNDLLDQRIGLDGTTLSWGDGTAANLGAGAIRGFEDMLTGNNSLNAGIPYYERKLDEFAQTMANVFNSMVHEDDPDKPGPFKTLIQGDFNGKVSAGSIRISDLWTKDSSYIIRKKNPDGDLDNEDILAMKAALEKDFEFGDGSDKFTGTFSEFITGYTNTLGTDKKTNDSRLKASLAIAESVESDRMGVSGVSLNEEGINMMTYNKAYSALGRLMTTMDEQLDMIINQMGLVGR